MRELRIGTKKHTTVYAVDEPKFGANHAYEIKCTDSKKGTLPTVLNDINFQKGPIKEHGVNGIHNEDLIAIVIDRLKGFQNTEFKCIENESALSNLHLALMSLGSRTLRRQERGVEGTSKI